MSVPFGDAAWVLLAVRVFAILRAQIVWRSAVGPTWPLMAAGLSLLLALGASPEGTVGELSLEAVVIEALVGTGIGIVVALPGWALLGASAASAAALRTGPRPFVGLMIALVGATALGLGVHQPALVALQASTEILPLGTIAAPIEPAEIARLLHAVTVLALSLCTPVVLAAAVVEVAGRLVAQGPGVAASLTGAATPWLRTGAALVALSASWQAYGAVWAQATVGVPR